MGAQVFYVSGIGLSAKEAFNIVVADAKYENGHGGYSGTIAEKSSCKSASTDIFENYKLAREFSEQLMSDFDHWCNDKWGPAAYVTFKSEQTIKYLFFGVASS